MSVQSKLFEPIRVGKCDLKHRVVMAPLTRLRHSATHVPGPGAAEYYAQRASTPGTLVVTESTVIAPQAGGFVYGLNTPGIWSDEQISEWKKIVEAVHAKGSFIFVQLWAMGRAAIPSILALDGPELPYVGASNIPLRGRDHEFPTALTIPEIKEYAQLHATAAINAIHKAGFDGVEINCAMGFLLDQFLQDVSNNRTDEYGGSIENRIRFPLEIIGAVVDAVGADRVGLKLSPWNSFQDMRMADPVPTFSALATRIRDVHPDFAYINVKEARIEGVSERPTTAEENNEFLRKIWGARLYLASGGYNREDAINTADEKGGLIVFGRWFISNPDLPIRLKKNIPLSPYDPNTFYTPDNVKGYTDYPFSGEDW